MVQPISIKPQYNLESFVLELGAAKQGKIPPTLGRGIHAFVLNLLKLGDEKIAAETHQSEVAKISLSNLIGNRRQPVTLEGDRFLLRICLLDGSLFEPLINGFDKSSDNTVILGKFPFVIREIHLLSDTHKLTKTTDYYSLAVHTPTYEEITLKFLSPTSFKQKQCLQSFPLPELVFNSLLRRWNYFAPRELHFSEVNWQVLVSAFDLKTHAVKLQAGAEIGCQGWVKYRFLNPQQARIASILAEFAFYAGVGRKTSVGMGQTHLEIREKGGKHE